MFSEMRHTTSYSGAIDAIGWLIFIEGFEETPLTTGKLPKGHYCLVPVASNSVSKQKSSLLQVSSAAHVPLDPQTTPFLFIQGSKAIFFYGKHQNTRFNHK